jgi:hypothetical protein
MASLSSRERLLLTIDHVEPDRVPFVFHLFDYPQEALPAHLRHDGQVERAERFLAAGLDDTLQFDVPWRFHPEVRTRVWKDQPPGEPYPLLHKVYETPKGPLTQVVKQTEDWPHGDDVEVFSDHNVPRSARFLVETEEDLERLPYILAAPSDEQIDGFRRQARELKRSADRLGVALEGHCGSGGDSAIWLCGVENFVMACRERPAFAHEVLRVIHEWEMDRLRLLLETGVCDIIVHRAWYEAPCFFSPSDFRTFLFDSTKREVDLVHQTGAKYQYIQTIGPEAFAPHFLDLGIDILWGVDPVQGGADLARVKRELGERVCLFGGLNSYVTLGLGDREKIRTAVREAIGVLGPGGGFALLPVCSIGKGIAWDGVAWAIEAWKEYGGYPLAV